MSMGRVYQRPGSPNWYIEYYCNGQKVRFSSRTTNKTEAKKALINHVNEAMNGKLPKQLRRHLSFNRLCELLIKDYEINERKSIDRARRSVKQLSEFFGKKTSGTIETSDICDYIEFRKDSGRSNATINRELSALKRMYNLAKEQKRIRPEDMPSFPKQLEEDNVREGYIRVQDLDKLLLNFPNYLKPVVKFAFYTGMRKSEIASIEWRQIDLDEGFAYLSAKQVKNRTARSVPLVPQVLEMLRELKKKKKSEGQKLVFTNTRGKAIGDFYKTWRKHVAEAGFEGLLFHDLRRSAVKALVEAGIPEKTCMDITGHKTLHVFHRYHIKDEQELRNAADVFGAYADKKKEEAMGD